jgi:hypothetical protein
MAAIAFPTWAYNLTQPALIVNSQAAFNALQPVGTWALTPFPASSTVVPFDPGFLILDERQQQLLVESRIANMLLQTMAGPNLDAVDMAGLRADVLANDSSPTS